MKVDAADIKTPSDEEAASQGCYIDEARADRVRAFLSRFVRHSKGIWAGEPFDLQPWQWSDLVRPLYGWIRPDGRRRFRRAYMSCGKKNGKSMLASGLALFHTISDDEPGALTICAATSREQAGLVFDAAADAVDQSAHLRAHIKVTPSRRRLEHPASRSVMQAIAADGGTNEGLQASAVIVDELHRWDAPRAADLWAALLYAGATRRQPIALYITTAGVDRESICWDRYQYARAIIDGTVVDPAFFAVIYEGRPDDDWADPETWRAANPSLGVTLGLDSFAEDYEEARQSPAKENAFRRYRLNQWTKAESRWLSSEAWEACGVDAFPDISGLPCWGGLDLASTTDLTAFALVWPMESGKSALRVWYWAPERAAKERERRNRPRLDTWVRDGWISETPGAATDYDRVRSDILGLSEEYQIQDIAYDPWNAAQLAGQLLDDGIAVVKFGQGYRSMSGPSKQFEAAVLDARIIHDRNPTTTWMVGNCQVEQDAAGNLKPSKAASHEKIDGVVASVMAMARSGVADSQGPAGSCYEGAGMII